MRFTQGSLSMLLQRYRAVLKKCHLFNALGGAVIVGTLLLGGGGLAQAASPISISDNHQVADGVTEEYSTIGVDNGGTLEIARQGKVVGTDVTVNTGGTLTSGKNLHIGTFTTPIPNTGLLANSLSVSGGTVTASHLGFSTNGKVTVGAGTLTLDSVQFGSESYQVGQLVVSGGTLEIGNLSIAHDKLVNSAADASLALNNNGQLNVRDTLSITGGSYTNTLAGAITTGKLLMDAGAKYTHNTVNSLNIIGTAGGGDFFTGNTFTVSQGDVSLGSDATPSGTHTTTAAVAVGGGEFQVGHGNWKTGALTQTGGTVEVSGNSVLTVDSLNQTDGLLTVGGNSNTGKLIVNGSFANTTYSADTAGVAVTGTGVLQAKYAELITGTDFKDTINQKAISVAEGGTLVLDGYSGSGMTVADFKTLTDNIFASGSNGTVQGITVTYNNETLQTVGDAHAALTSTVVQGGNLDGSTGTNAAAAVGGVTGATTVTGNASLTLTGQNTGNVLADAGVTLNNGSLTLGNPAGGSTGGTLNGGIDARTGTNTINVVNGIHTVNGGLTGGANTTVAVGGSTNAGTLIATDINMNGGQINFDPPFVAAGDVSNASLGGLTFSASTVDALMNVGQNSMVSLGSTDAEWLRTEVTRFQQDGKGLWGRDITAALAIRAPQTMDATGGINVDGTWVSGGAPATANTAHFADKSLLVVDAIGVGSKVALSGASGGSSTLTVDAGAKLHIVGGRDGETVNITKNFAASTMDAASWTDANLTTSTALLSATGGTFDPTTGTYSVSLKANAVAAAFPKLSNEIGALVDQMVLKPGVDVNSSQAGVRFLSRAVSDNYIGTANRDQAAATIEGATRMAVIGGVPQMTWAANNAAGNAVTQRTGLAQPTGNAIQSMAADGSMQTGASAGDAAKTGFAMWIMPLYQSWNGYGLEGGNFDLDVSGGLGGVALGADYTFAEAIRAGITFNIGGGYATGSGDFNETTNNMNFWGVGAYLGWAPGNFGLTADVNYTSTYNKLEQDLPSGMQMGKLKSDVTAYAISAGLRGEYKLETSVLDIIPHLGVRYTSLNTDEYDVKSGGTVLKGDAMTQSIWTFPVGVAFSKEIDTGNGWHFKPSLDLAVIPAAGDIKARGDVRFTGVSGTAEVETQTMDYITYMGQAGLEFGNDTVSLGVNYNLQVGARSTAHGVFGTFRYEF